MIIVAAASISVSSLIAMQLSTFSNLTVPTLGTIKTIGVEAYYDHSISNRTEEIDWGTFLSGTEKSMTLYIRSVSNVEVTLSLTTDNWSPNDISGYMVLSWDYNGASLAPDSITQVTLTLSTSSSSSLVRYLIDNSVQNFTFDIHFVAVE